MTANATYAERVARALLGDVRRVVSIAESSLDSLIVIRRACEDARARIVAGSDPVSVGWKLDASIYVEMKEVDLFEGDLSPVIAPIARSLGNRRDHATPDPDEGWASEVELAMASTEESVRETIDGVRRERDLLIEWSRTFPIAAEQIDLAVASCDRLEGMLTRLLPGKGDGRGQCFPGESP